MTGTHYDAIVVGSGAGGSAVAYALVQAGQRVLILEKGESLPRDGSTLDVKQVLGEGRFKNLQAWVDRHNEILTPDEFCNVGGKTKWYGAALLRFAPHEFDADPAFQCLGWPISYAELEPYYAQAEALLGVHHFDHEPGLKKLIGRIAAGDAGWRAQALPLGLKDTILQHPDEAKHFDGFASPGGYKADAEQSLLQPMMSSDRCALLQRKEVSGFTASQFAPTSITGVRCIDGSTYRAAQVILAAGAMNSPRLLQDYLEQTGLNSRWPSASRIGANFKLHLNSVLLGISPLVQRDLLRKTAIFFNDVFPHSSVQCLGWLDGEILATQLPKSIPRFVSHALGARAYGFFVTTEDGSSVDNRIVSRSTHGTLPMLNYDLKRIPASAAEHQFVTGAFRRRLLRAGLVSVAKPMGLTGTAHALGSLVAGRDPEKSVVDENGKVHGLEGLYVADGSILPRSSRVNPALTIYAWGLRLGEHLSRREP
jgi:choline dehydrogenase-like flavoprotein